MFFNTAMIWCKCVGQLELDPTFNKQNNFYVATMFDICDKFASYSETSQSVPAIVAGVDTTCKLGF